MIGPVVQSVETQNIGAFVHDHRRSSLTPSLAGQLRSSPACQGQPGLQRWTLAMPAWTETNKWLLKERSRQVQRWISRKKALAFCATTSEISPFVKIKNISGWIVWICFLKTIFKNIKIKYLFNYLFSKCVFKNKNKKITSNCFLNFFFILIF